MIESAQDVPIRIEKCQRDIGHLDTVAGRTCQHEDAQLRDELFFGLSF